MFGNQPRGKESNQDFVHEGSTCNIPSRPTKIMMSGDVIPEESIPSLFNKVSFMCDEGKPTCRHTMSCRRDSSGGIE